jgi:DNA-binding IclR family transcriptional regulator
MGKYNEAVERTLDILEAISNSHQGLTNASLSRRLRLPKSSASYILRTLIERGYLRREAEGRRYQLGFPVHALGNKVHDAVDVRDVTLPVMRDLAKEIDLVCSLTISSENSYEIVCIEKVFVRRYYFSSKVGVPVGARPSLFDSAAGKLLLAQQPPAETERMLQTAKTFRDITGSLLNFKKFKVELEHIRNRGYALCDKPTIGFRAVAVPIFDDSGRTQIAINANGAAEDLPDSRLPDIHHLLTAAAHEASRRLSVENRIHRQNPHLNPDCAPIW